MGVHRSRPRLILPPGTNWYHGWWAFKFPDRTSFVPENIAYSLPQISKIIKQACQEYGVELQLNIQECTWPSLPTFLFLREMGRR